MKQVKITVTGTVKHPETKVELEKFSFTIDGTEVENISDVDSKTAFGWVRMQHKIVQLNTARTEYQQERLSALGLSKAKVSKVDPITLAIMQLLKTGTPEQKKQAVGLALSAGITQEQIDQMT